MTWTREAPQPFHDSIHLATSVVRNLRPMIPKASMQAILNMDPNATWPQ